MLDNLKNLIVRVLRLDCEPSTLAAIDRANIRHIRLMASFIATIEALMLLYALFSPTVMAEMRLTIALSLLFIIAVCVAALGITTRMLEAPRTKPLVAWALLTTLFAVASIWGMLASFRHYVEGGQIITFYIVQLCFVCFLVMRPPQAAAMFGGSFGIFYLVLYMFDGAPTINKANYAAFAVVSIVGAIVRYQTQVDELRERREVRKLNKRLYHTSMHDELTGLLNRHALRERFDSFLGREVCVMLFDVDGFKRYNDTFGHLAGDSVLSSVARVTLESFPNGMTFRYGGDELLVIQPEMDEEAMVSLISKWQRAVGDITVEGVSEKISCSHGMVHDTPATADELRHMIKLADDALYREKTARGTLRRA